jgi:hypothetical protein
MRDKGFGGAMIMDAGGAGQQGNHEVPAGPLFGSPAWRELLKHTLREAARLDLELSLNIMSGWNLGGPTVKPEHSAKLVTWSKTFVKGPSRLDQTLPAPASREGFYRDVAVLAFPLRNGAEAARRPIGLLEFKASFKEFGYSMPATEPLLFDSPSEAGEEDAAVGQVRLISEHMDASGRLRWDVPPGDWEILRFGYTSSGRRVSTGSGDWQGLVIDYLDRSSLESYWNDVVAPILADARPWLGKPLAYLVSDSWELRGVNWTPRFRQEFRARRGYDPLPWLPVMTGRILDNRDMSIRFLNDLRRTIGDLVADEHYSAFAALARTHGLGIHPEAGGPHGGPIDALKCLGRGAFPQMEFWAKFNTVRIHDEDRFFVKEAASAGHIYGKTIVAAEGLTSIGPHWQESFWSNLKPSFDRALGEGLNRLIWHTFTCSPAEMGHPGQEYFAGTHLNPNITWWKQSGAFLSYINRSQFLLQQGHFVADVLYYYGDHVPNFVRLKTDDPARVLPGYDYDVTNEEVLLHRLGVRDGRLTLPGGMSYRVLVLPDLPMISLGALRKIRDLASAGATIVGRRPERVTGLTGLPASDEEVRRLGAEIWGDCNGVAVRERRYGRGRVVCGKTARQVLSGDGVPPDMEYSSSVVPGGIDYIHRSLPDADIYFVYNQRDGTQTVDALFRVAGRAPEFWDPVTARIRRTAVYQDVDGARTRVRLRLKPHGSTFVVFRRAAQDHIVAMDRPAEVWMQPDGGMVLQSNAPGTYKLNTSTGREITISVAPLAAEVPVEGPWDLAFSSPAATPPPMPFATLQSWTGHSDPLVRFFSGTVERDVAGGRHVGA